MAQGNITCRHTLQTGLLNCGLEHTGIGLRNVHTLGGGLGPRRKGKHSSASLHSSQVSIFRARLMSLMKAVDHFDSLYGGQTSGSILRVCAAVAFVPCASLIRGVSQSKTGLGVHSAVNHVTEVSHICLDPF